MDIPTKVGFSLPTQVTTLVDVGIVILTPSHSASDKSGASVRRLIKKSRTKGPGFSLEY